MMMVVMIIIIKSLITVVMNSWTTFDAGSCKTALNNNLAVKRGDAIYESRGQSMSKPSKM
jgi:hypothetical protein